MNTKQLAGVLGGLLASLTLMSCDLDIPDLNNPGVGTVEDNPTPAIMGAAATGLFVVNRANKATTTGWVNLLGILGRESYDFDPNDGRFVTEMIVSNLSQSSPFGGAFWLPQYQNIRNANLIIDNLDKVSPPFTEQEKNAYRGFAHTMQAVEFMTLVASRDESGAVIDTDHPVGDPLRPVVSKAEVLTEIHRLLDLAKTELIGTDSEAGEEGSFPFTIAPGFSAFGTPRNFIKFNRAIKARALSYQAPSNKDLYPSMVTALTESFINDTATPISFTLGANYTFSTAAGDQTNALTNRNIYAHPKLETDAKTQNGLPGGAPDARYTAKIVKIDNGGSASDGEELTTTIRFRNLGQRVVNDMTLPADSPRMYANTTSIPMIRNEDLILLRAEALWFTNEKAAAVAELNLVRQGPGKLPALALPATDEAFIDELLYDRRYSLMFEGGHRWIDLRRFGRELPLDDPEHKANVRFPLPLPECDARPEEARCKITSSGPIP